MAHEFREGLDSLVLGEHKGLQDLVEEAELRLLRADWSHLTRSDAYVEMTPPADLLQGAVKTLRNLVDAIERVDERWRLDAVLAIEDYID